MKVKISDDKLHAIDSNGKIYPIKFESKSGEDLTGLAKMASKSYWFDKDRPQYTPSSLQEGKLTEEGTIIIKNNGKYK